MGAPQQITIAGDAFAARKFYRTVFARRDGKNDFDTLAAEFRQAHGPSANGMAFRKSDTALQQYANNFIAEAEKSGELSAINQRWFGVPLTKLPPMPQT